MYSDEKEATVKENLIAIFKFLILVILILGIGSFLDYKFQKQAESNLNYEDKNMSELFFKKYGNTMDSIGLNYIKELGPKRSDIEININLKALNLKPEQQHIGTYCDTPHTDMSYLLIDNENKILKMHEATVAQYGKEAIFKDFEYCLESTLAEVKKLKQKNDNLGQEFKLNEQ